MYSWNLKKQMQSIGMEIEKCIKFYRKTSVYLCIPVIFPAYITKLKIIIKKKNTIPAAICLFFIFILHAQCSSE